MVATPPVGAVLGARYEYNARPFLRLNPLQEWARSEIERKLQDGTYQLCRVSCCICHGDTFETLATRDRYGLRLHVVICVNCGLIQTNPRMTEASYGEFYNVVE